MAEIYQPEAIPKVVIYLSSLLQRVAEANDSSDAALTSPTSPLDSVPPPPQRVSVFHGLCKPVISIQSYLERIFRYANCSPSCFIVAYIYLDRFVSRQPAIPITSYNVHRLLITSVLVAAKFMDDLYYNNAYYAKVGGICTQEMNCLEIDFLFGIGFQLNVTPSTFHAYCKYLQREMLEFESSGIGACIQRPLKIHGRFPFSSPNSDESNSQNTQQLVSCCTNKPV
ncbi:unnamed protein product [Victoria cruziana]